MLVNLSQGGSKNFFEMGHFIMPLLQSLKTKCLIIVLLRGDAVLKINLYCLSGIVHFKSTATRKIGVAWHWQYGTIDLTLLHLHSY